MLSITGFSAVPKLAPPTAAPALLTSAYNWQSTHAPQQQTMRKSLGHPPWMPDVVRICFQASQTMHTAHSEQQR